MELNMMSHLPQGVGGANLKGDTLDKNEDQLTNIQPRDH